MAVFSAASRLHLLLGNSMKTTDSLLGPHCNNAKPRKCCPSFSFEKYRLGARKIRLKTGKMDKRLTKRVKPKFFTLLSMASEAK